MNQVVISASRRSDIPAFYMDWFMKGISDGHFSVINPYNQRAKEIRISPELVHTIVFWSKDFGPFLNGQFGERLQRRGYHLFFNFTINSDNPDLEAHVPSLKHKLDQLEELVRRFNPECINWRFDPICFYKTADGKFENNLKDFSTIASRAATLGIRRCITSFMDHYKKIDKRLGRLNGFVFLDPSQIEKKNIILNMEQSLKAANISLQMCCEKELLKELPETSYVTSSACIPNDLLMKLYGGNISTRKDSGQRRSMGCQCNQSIDIGSYRWHPCYHNCLFCYANPSSEKGRFAHRQIKDH